MSEFAGRFETSSPTTDQSPDHPPEQDGRGSDYSGRASAADQDGELDYSTLPDPTSASDYDDGELDYSTLPDPASASDYDDGGLDYSTLPDPGSASKIDSARSELDRQYAIQQYQAEAEAAYESGPTGPRTSEEFSAKADAWAERAAAGGIQSPPGADNVDSARQSVIEDAKADLVAREERGDRLGGKPYERADLWHEQGANDLGYQNDCALAATAAVLRDGGVDATEDDIVRQAVAEHRCATTESDPAANGGVRDLADLRDILQSRGLHSEVTHLDSVDELATLVDDGHGVIAPVNSAELWDGRYPVSDDDFQYDETGRAIADHAVTVTGTIRDESGDVIGFVVNDTGTSEGAADQVSRGSWDRCWTQGDRDREVVVTARPASVERSTRQ